MNINQMAQLAAFALAGLFGLLGLILLVSVLLGRQKTTKVVVDEGPRSYFDQTPTKSTSGKAPTVRPAATGFSFPQRAPVQPGGATPVGSLPPNLRARPLNPQEIFDSIAEKDQELGDLPRPAADNH